MIEHALALLASKGSVRNCVNSPPGAVYAAEMLKEDERKKRDKNYIPPWNPGKEK